MAFDLDPSYKQVPDRIADFKEKHPEGCLQPADTCQPFTIETIGDRTFIVYTAAAYRSPEDPRPGIGIAWEPFPGKTPYTRDSELQNAETSAWGRAIVAVLASESKSVASAEDVRNRRADQDAPPLPPPEPKPFDLAGFLAVCESKGLDPADVLAFAEIDKPLHELGVDDRGALGAAIKALDVPTEDELAAVGDLDGQGSD